MNETDIDNRAWACFFADGEAMFSSVSRTQKGSIKLARIHMKEDNWRALKSRGIRCEKVEVIKVSDSSNANVTGLAPAQEEQK